MPKLISSKPLKSLNLKPSKFPTLADYVISNVKPEDYYALRFASDRWSSHTRTNVRCLWHKEKTGSLALCLRNGGAKCHGCGKSIGNIVHFESLIPGAECSEIEAAQKLYDEFCHKIFPAKQCSRYSANLQFAPFFLSSLQNDLGLTLASIKQFELGLDNTQGRITIPIYNQFKKITNVRYYQLPSMREGKNLPKILNAKGYGYLELFPWPLVKNYTPEEPLFWMKAERDTMLAIQDGLQAVCTTGAGESASISEWVNLFEGFQTYVLGDSDETGRREATKKVEQLIDAGVEARTIELPTTEKDYSDWRLKDEGTAGALLRLLKKEKLPTKEERKQKAKAITNGDIPFASLQQIKSNIALQNEPVRTRGIIIGILDRSYSIPKAFMCSSGTTPKRRLDIDISRELIWMVRAGDEDIIKFVQQKFFPHQKVKLEPCEYIKATEVEVCPLVDFNESIENHGGYTIYRGIYVGEHIDTNVSYELEVLPTTSIRTQEQIGIIRKAKPITGSIDTTVFSEEEMELLESIRNTGDNIEDFWEEFCNFANEISLHYTRIYNRLDWHIVALLTWLSPLYFNYPNEGTQRGWLNSLVIGDTQTGKSQVVNQLQQLFNCGNVVNAENCTFVGLVGGTVKNSSGQFVLRWGRIPVNDRQFVAIEELSGLSTAEISRMSEVRSSGVARIDKAGITAETFARTRLLALSNVRGLGKSLSNYPTGVRAILELVGQSEDVSRFDLITTLTDEEVSSKVINAQGQDMDEIVSYEKETLRLLVRFIWCLKPEQIDFTQKAYVASLQYAQAMALEFHPSVPIFKAGSGRLKLARIATAIACSQFSWNKAKQKIEVTELHIFAAAQLLRMLYNKESFGYGRYSKKAFSSEHIPNPDALAKNVFAILKNENARKRFFAYILDADGFTDRQFEQIGGLSQFDGRKVFGLFIDGNIIEKAGRDYWRASKAGRAWLDKHK